MRARGKARHTLQSITFVVNPDLAARAVPDLREAVGWGRLDADYPAALAGYWATVGGFDAAGELVAWCAVIADGVRHAALLDVIVHPRVQRQGVGSALVRRAIAHIRSRGIAIIHVDFVPEHSAFYERCGFRVGLGGIYEE